MGAVADRLKLDLDEMKQYLGVAESDDSQDEDIRCALDAAKDDADAFLCNPFFHLDIDGTVVEDPIPATVKQWVKRRVARYIDRRVEGIQIETVDGVGSAHWGSDEYRGLWPHRMNPGF